MNTLAKKIQFLTGQFTILPEEINIIAENFRQTMVAGLAGKPSPLKMLASYLGKPSGDETGTFLALDFGGTNVRVLLTELFGHGKVSIQARAGNRLKDPNGHYNYISAQATANELFDFIAEQIATLVTPDSTYPLGHTFSFPTHQTGLNTGTLINWTKEFETQHVEGQDISALLTAALERKNLTNVVPKVIVNDTVGTLLTAAYADNFTDIGSICGTGHNTAYLEPFSPLTNGPMIINLESGNFGQLPLTSYDLELDTASEKPGAQLLEKMVSGHYIGEIVRIIICNLFADGLLATSTGKERLLTPYLLNGAHISLLQEDDTADLSLINTWLTDSEHITNSSLEDRQALKTIATLVSVRSARLVAATYLGIIKHMDPQLQHKHNIAIDGSLYEKTPGYAAAMQLTLDQGLTGYEATATTSLSKDGSGIGAAIATAIAVTMEA